MLPKSNILHAVLLLPQLPSDCFSLSSLEFVIFIRQKQRQFQWGVSLAGGL